MHIFAIFPAPKMVTEHIDRKSFSTRDGKVLKDKLMESTVGNLFGLQKLDSGPVEPGGFIDPPFYFL
jgi:hypothetical protein